MMDVSHLSSLYHVMDLREVMRVFRAFRVAGRDVVAATSPLPLISALERLPWISPNIPYHNQVLIIRTIDEFIPDDMPDWYPILLFMLRMMCVDNPWTSTMIARIFRQHEHYITRDSSVMGVVHATHYVHTILPYAISPLTPSNVRGIITYAVINVLDILPTDAQTHVIYELGSSPVMRQDGVLYTKVLRKVLIMNGDATPFHDALADGLVQMNMLLESVWSIRKCTDV
jgi:hypothetical protein